MRTLGADVKIRIFSGLGREEIQNTDFESIEFILVLITAHVQSKVSDFILITSVEWHSRRD